MKTALSLKFLKDEKKKILLINIIVYYCLNAKWWVGEGDYITKFLQKYTS